MTTKRCPHCGEVKPSWLFGWRSKAKGKLNSWCYECNNAARRERYRKDPERRKRDSVRRGELWQLQMQDPEYHAQWLAYNRERLRAQRRLAKTDPELRAKLHKWRADAWARLKADPERHAVHLANRRIDYRVRAEASGRKVTRAPKTATNPAAEVRAGGRGGHGLMLDPAPFVEFIAQRGGPHAVALGDEPLARALRRIVRGEHAHASLHIVDQILCLHDLCMHDIYDPTIYPEVFAA